MRKRSVAVTFVLALSAAVSPVMAGVAEAALPPGCTLSTIDGGRSSYAKCSAPNSYVHSTTCVWGGNIDVYVRPFTRTHITSCRSNYRVRNHTIYLA